jgi:hypothetical protein
MMILIIESVEEPSAENQPCSSRQHPAHRFAPVLVELTHYLATATLLRTWITFAACCLINFTPA